MDPINPIIYAVPAIAIFALIYAMIRANWVRSQDAGDDRMQMIGTWIADGAMAFLAREYRALSVFVVAVAVLLAISNSAIGAAQNTKWLIAVLFMLGVVCFEMFGLFCV